MSHFKREFEGNIDLISQKQMEAAKQGVSFESLQNNEKSVNPTIDMKSVAEELKEKYGIITDGTGSYHANINGEMFTGSLIEIFGKIIEANNGQF